MSISLNTIRMTAIGAIVMSSGAALAQSEADWTVMQKDGASAGNEFLVPSTASESSAMFACKGGKFRAVISTEPQALGEIFGSNSKTKFSREKFYELHVNGENVSKEKWGVDRRRGLVMSKSHKPALKLYNAAIRGDDVELVARGVDPVKVQLPKANAEFGGFGGACGIGNNRKS